MKKATHLELRHDQVEARSLAKCWEVSGVPMGSATLGVTSRSQTAELQKSVPQGSRISNSTLSLTY